MAKSGRKIAKSKGRSNPRMPRKDTMLAIAAAVVIAGGITISAFAFADPPDVAEQKQRITTAYPTSAPVVDRLFALANTLGVKPEWIANVIQFESGWNPASVNPNGGASGLIQFYPGSTDRALGTTVEAIRRMGVSQQFGLVERYFLGGAQHPSFAGKLKSQLDVFMAVFQPDAIGKGLWYAFSEGVRRNNPGILTASDYYNKAMSHARLV